MDSDSNTNRSRTGSDALAVAREFEPATRPRGLTGLPAYESRVPEPMNNYNLPKDRRLIEEKVARLKEQFPTFANKSADDLEDLLRFEDLFQAHIDGLEQ
ncbi:hypothetical protein IWW50_004660, partial [Coemansia erecta]